MKTYSYLWLVYALAGTPLLAQTPAWQPPGSNGPAAYTVASRGQNHTTWQRVKWTTNQFGAWAARTNRVVELQSGRRYQQGGLWLDSQEQIDIAADGGIASHGPHKASFSGNINSAVSVQVQTPDNKQLKIRPLGLAYYDFQAPSNNCVMIAQLKDSDGLLVASNRVLYPDAFDNLKADVRYTYRKSGVEQDIILKQRPVLPEEFGFNPASTRLLFLTEFIDPPSGVKQVQQVRWKWRQATVSKVVDFGAMKIGPGLAFNFGQETNRVHGVPVQKQWQVLEGRTFLIEEVPFWRILPSLANLQARAQPGPATGLYARRKEELRDLISPALQTVGVRPKRQLQLASGPLEEKGFVLDFNLQNGEDRVLQGDTTYVVTGEVNLSGTTVIEGGAVIKFNRGGRINFWGPVQCDTKPYRPAYFTAIDDNSVGDLLGNGAPDGAYADCALALNQGADLQYLRIRYANEAVYCAYNNYSLKHSQILNCQYGMHSESAGFACYNVLMSQVGYPFYGSSFQGDIQHLTADQADTLVYDPNFTYYDCEGGPSSSASLVNCLTASIANGYGIPALYLDHVQDFGSAADVFQSVGGGNYYLADNSPYRQSGATCIDGGLQAALSQKTTYPPIVLSNLTLAADTTLWPQAQRETAAPDWGYAYEPLDYLLSLNVNACTLTLTNGVAVAVLGPGGPGISLNSGARLCSVGLPLNLNHITGCGAVQEWGAVLPSSTIKSYSGQESVQLRFTDLSFAGAGTYFDFVLSGKLPASLDLRDCQFASASFYYNLDAAQTIPPSPPVINVANCLFERCQIYVQDMAPADGDDGAGLNVNWFNNLFHNGTISLMRQTALGQWSIHDNIFDHVAFSDASSVSVPNGYNAFISTALFPFPGRGTIYPGAIPYVSGALGKYYQADSSPCINAGSCTAAAAGLYHYTVRPNNLKEGDDPPGTVDIGLHYVALGGDGKPVDSDGDGIPDYLEDANGNGVPDSGETNWQDPIDLGLQVIITRPKNNSVIP